MSLTDFWKIGSYNMNHIWMGFPEIGLCRALEFFEYHFRLYGPFWMGFPEFGLCHAPYYKIVDWMSFPEIGLKSGFRV